MKKTLLATALLTSINGSYAADKAPTPAAAPITQATPAAIASPAQPVAPVINCEYRIPASTKTIENSVLTQWAEKAAIQAFDFNPDTLDTQLKALKNCYTELGWRGFDEAIKKSGNIDAIKTQHLSVSSQVDGKSTISAIKTNQWKVTMPLQVVYQNEKQKLTQSLKIELMVGRKPSGDLGIMQIIATPRQAAKTAQTS